MPRLVRYLMKCFGDADMRDAADAAHNAFVELFTKWDAVRTPRAWLRTVAFRQMLRQNARPEYPLEMLGQEPATAPASARLELAEETQAVLHLFRQLPLAQRRVLALLYDEFTYREIAQITETSEDAVRKNAERAKRKMSELLKSHMEIASLTAIWDRGSNPPSTPPPAGPMLQHRHRHCGHHRRPDRGRSRDGSPGPDTSPSSRPTTRGA